ncbi:hypothetical protein DENSPDRAFT_851478 [Dentipellis sp. KUC8613]|nr:hypothetical protein DENSPDRAFT_851478 [Dentipellis sp. KUC8613]
MSLSFFRDSSQPLTFKLAYARTARDLTFRSAQLIYQGDGTEVYRGRLFRPSDTEGEDVVCKVAYRSTAVSSIDHEAMIYTQKLRHLQGVCVPLCHGYFVNRDRMDLRSCLILAYSGEPIKKAFAALDSEFKKALVHAAMLLHDAGVKYGDWDEENILDYEGLPMIIDLEHAELHDCKRVGEIVQGGLAPRIQDFQCNELYQLCEDLEYWKPGMIKYIHGYIPITKGMTPADLAATAPRYVPRDLALKKAKAAIRKHVKENYPDLYEEWNRQGSAYPPPFREVLSLGEQDFGRNNQLKVK